MMCALEKGNKQIVVIIILTNTNLYLINLELKSYKLCAGSWQFVILSGDSFLIVLFLLTIPINMTYILQYSTEL